jgi:hypothetical protein
MSAKEEACYCYVLNVGADGRAFYRRPILEIADEGLPNDY